MTEVVRSFSVETALYMATNAGDGSKGIRTYGTQTTKTTAEIPMRARQSRNAPGPNLAFARKAPSSSQTVKGGEIVNFLPSGKAFSRCRFSAIFGGQSIQCSEKSNHTQV